MPPPQAAGATANERQFKSQFKKGWVVFYMARGRWKNKTSGNGKFTLFTFVLYPESEQAIIDYVEHNWSCAWAVHDKDKYDQHSYDEFKKEKPDSEPDWHIDDLKKLHIHFNYKPKNQRSIHGVAHELGLPDFRIRVGDDERALYEYLWHKDDSTKYQYDKSIVHCHDYDEPSDDSSAYLSDKQQAKTILTIPDTVTCYDDLIHFALDNDCWECLSTKFPMWKAWFDEHKFQIGAVKTKDELNGLDNSSVRPETYNAFHSDASRPATWNSFSGSTLFDEKG